MCGIKRIIVTELQGILGHEPESAKIVNVQREILMTSIFFTFNLFGILHIWKRDWHRVNIAVDLVHVEPFIRVPVLVRLGLKVGVTALAHKNVIIVLFQQCEVPNCISCF